MLRLFICFVIAYVFDSLYSTLFRFSFFYFLFLFFDLQGLIQFKSRYVDVYFYFLFI